MKKSILGSFIVFLLLNLGCAKDKSCIDKTVASEDAAMQAFANTNGITATRHSSGMYYQVVNPGSGTTPTLASNVSVTYIGRLTNGTIFDQTATPTSFYPLSGFIPGWQLGLPLVQEGGSVKLIIPSSLAYGCSGAGSIPGNSILYFEITLVDVQ